MDYCCFCIFKDDIREANAWLGSTIMLVSTVYAGAGAIRFDIGKASVYESVSHRIRHVNIEA